MSGIYIINSDSHFQRTGDKHLPCPKQKLLSLQLKKLYCKNYQSLIKHPLLLGAWRS